jgi:hypothetical protein
MTQTSTRFTFPDEQVLVIRPSFNTICCKVRPAAKVLSYLCYQYNNNRNPQLDENGGFTVKRTQAELVTAICDEMDVKTLHDTAIPWLLLLGFIDLIENQGTTPNEYIVYPDKVQAAISVCNQPQALRDMLSSNARLELFLIEELPLRLEKVLIVDKKKFQSSLEKVLIYIRKSSNHKRGRKAATGEALEAVYETPKISKINKDNKRDSKTGAANASATTDQPPTLPLLKPDEKKSRGRKPTAEKQLELPISLSTGGQAVWDNWCRMPWFKFPPKLTDTVAQHCENLAKYNPTYESMLASKNWATSSAVDRKGWYKNKAWSLYWQLQEYPKWLSIAPATQEEKKPTPINPDKLVWWTRFSDHEGDPESHWYLYEKMPLAHAMKDPMYELMSLPPAIAVNIETLYGQLERGEITLPRNIPVDAPANSVKCIA